MRRRTTMTAWFFGIALAASLSPGADEASTTPPPAAGKGRVVLEGLTAAARSCEINYSAQPQFSPEAFRQAQGKGAAVDLDPGTWHIFVASVTLEKNIAYYVNFMGGTPLQVTVAAGETVSLPVFKDLKAQLTCTKQGAQTLRIDFQLVNAAGAKVAFSMPSSGTAKPPSVLIVDAEGHAVDKSNLQPG